MEEDMNRVVLQEKEIERINFELGMVKQHNVYLRRRERKDAAHIDRLTFAVGRLLELAREHKLLGQIETKKMLDEIYEASEILDRTGAETKV